MFLVGPIQLRTFLDSVVWASSAGLSTSVLGDGTAVSGRGHSAPLDPAPCAAEALAPHVP